MGILSLLLLLSGVIETKPSPIFVDVSIGTHGPYRFLVDTGAQTSFIDTKLARKLSLRPEFQVEVVTLNGSRFVPGLKTSALKIGDRALPETEMLFEDVAEARRLDPSIQGVLGINALTGFDFVLSPVSSRLEQTAKRPAGEVLPFDTVDGGIAIKARMGTETLTFILDSGASHVVLFHVPAAMAATHSIASTASTMEGARSVVPTRWTEDMTFGDRLRVGMLPAAIVERNDTHADGLLPASVFKKIYVDNSHRELVVVR